MGATASTCIPRASGGAAGDPEQTSGTGGTRRASRIDPVASHSPLFKPDEALREDDVELMNGLNCHTAAYVVVEVATEKVRFVSEAFERRTGFPASKAQGEPAMRLLHEVVALEETDSQALEAALRGQKSTLVPVAGKIGKDPKAETVYMQWYLTPLRAADAEAEAAPAYMLCAPEQAPDEERCQSTPSRSLAYRLRNANDCKRLGKEGWTLFVPYKPLCDTDRTLVDMLQERGEMFCITDPGMHDNPIVFSSDGFIDMTGYNRYEINGINCRFLQGVDTSPEDVQIIRHAIQHETHTRVCLLNYRKDGTRFINQFNISPLRDVDGKLAYFIGVQMAVDDCEILPFPNTRQSMAEMMVEMEREEMGLSFEQVAN